MLDSLNSGCPVDFVQDLSKGRRKINSLKTKHLFTLNSQHNGIMPLLRDTDSGKERQSDFLISIQKYLLRLVDLGKYQVIPGKLEQSVVVAESKDALKMQGFILIILQTKRNRIPVR